MDPHATGSTGTELEDPENRTPDPQETPANTPADEGNEREASAQPAEPATAKPQGVKPKDEDDDGAEDEPEDPVAQAIKHLATDKAKDAQAKPAKPTAPTGTTPAGEQPNAAKPDESTDEPGTTEPDPVTADPTAEWSATERKHTKGTVKERFRQERKLRADAEAARARVAKDLEAAKPQAELGELWDGLIRSQGLADEVSTLDDQQIAEGLRAQGASARISRAIASGRQPAAKDLQVIDQQRRAIEQIDRAIGRPARGTAAPAAFTGPIPDDVREMGDLYGMPEDEQRALAAHRAAKKAGPKPTDAPPVQAQRAAEEQQPPAPRATAPNARWSPEEDRLESYAALEDIRRKVNLDEQGARALFDQAIGPAIVAKLQRAFPGKDPTAVFDSLHPTRRRAEINEALDAHVQRKAQKAPATPAPTTTSKPAPAPTRQTPLRATGTSRPGSAASADPVQAAINRLSSDR